MKVAVIVAVVLSFALASNAEVFFRRDAAQLAALEDSVNTLRENLNNQARTLDFASGLASSSASSSDANLVRDEIRFLVERSLQFADADDLQSLTDAVVSAAALAQSSRVATANLRSALPAVQSSARRTLELAISEAGQYENTVTTVESLEADYVSLLAFAPAAFNSLNETYTTTDLVPGSFEKNVTEVSEEVEPVFERFMSVDRTRLNNIVSTLTEQAQPSRTRSLWHWTIWSSYDYGYSWFAGNNAGLFGGVNPSTWGDNQGRAYQMSNNFDTLRGFFRFRGSGGANANIWPREWRYTSSTNSYYVAMLFRIRNNSGNTINWNTYFWYSSYWSWGEAASIAVNGGNTWYSSSNCNPSGCNANVNLGIPANSINTVIFVTGSGNPSNTRGVSWVFYNNCLTLPQGLEYEDDFATATSFQQSL